MNSVNSFSHQMHKKKQFYLRTYGKSLSEFAQLTGNRILVQKETGEFECIEKDIYLCPLCMRNFFFFRDGDYFESAAFSDDHYPPESVGGTDTILVCKPCNDFYGRTVDYVLKEYLKSQAFLSKEEKSSYPLKFSYVGIPGTYNINTEWFEGKMLKSVDFKKYPYIKKWIFDFKKEDWSFNLKISFPSEELIAKALLRAAYLYCFANWGYDFAFSVAGKNLRDVLHSNKQHPLKNLGVFGDVSSKELQNGFYFITNPQKNRSFQVVFDIALPNSEIKKKIFVIIPGNSEKAWTDLKFFNDWIEKKKKNTKLIKLYSDCVMKEYYTHYRFTWQKLKTE